MDETTRLVRRVIDAGLLGDDVLLEPDRPDVPDRYDLVRELGRGGAGTVWLAHDQRLDRAVAVKFLHEARAADHERFRREARFAARLDVPSIVPVYEMGEIDGRPFIVMRYLEGGSLAQSRLDLRGLVEVMRQVTVALESAHAGGIVHRDVKPENILLDKAGAAYVADFGIARDLVGQSGATISHDGQIIGTPGLMPPEQARGDLPAIDARSDVYAIGSTLYTMLTGRHPFVGANIVDILHAVLHDPPTLPRSLNVSIPRELETIMMRCLRKSREERYRDMAALRADLTRFLAAAPEETGSAWFRQLVTQRTEAPEAPPSTASDPERVWADALEIARDIAAWDTDLYRVSGSLERSFERLDAITARLDGILDSRPDLAWARFYRGVARMRRGHLVEAMDDIERSVDRVPDRAGAYFELGRLYLAMYLHRHRLAQRHLVPVGVVDHLANAEALLDQAVVALEEAERSGSPRVAWQLDYTRAVRRLAIGDHARCVAICDHILEREPDVEEVWRLRGDAQRAAGDDPIESYDRALDVRRTDFEALYAKAEALLERGAIAAAREALERACAIHPSFGRAQALLARSYLDELRGGSTDVDIDNAIVVARGALDADPECFDAAVGLAELLLVQGETPASIESVEGWYPRVLETLDRAARLDGCGNRVNLLRARAHLTWARQQRAAGADPRELLDAALALYHPMGANAEWDRVRDACLAERERD